MTRTRGILPLLLVALALAGCAGGERPGGGSATLWVTRDRGAVVVLEARVPAGQTLLRALRSKADVGTRYGGRFVQSIDGIEGSGSRQRDWFWLVNGYVGATSAAEYRLRDGDVAWWDYRSWRGDAETLDVVAGAFPEPFLHGFGGKTRAAAVRYPRGMHADARRVARAIGATDVAVLGTPVPAAENVLELGDRAAPAAIVARLRSPGSGPGAPVHFIVAGGVDRLLAGRFTRSFGS